MSTDSARTSHYDTSTKGMVAYGVTAFAGVMLATVAVFQIFEGIAAIAKDDVYVAGIKYTFELDITAWGWIHLLLGVIALAVGIGILMGQTWSRVAGIVIAALSCLSNFAFLPYFPIWSLVILAFNAFVIWALCTQMSHDARL
jgi:hypothetical protein